MKHTYIRNLEKQKIKAFFMKLFVKMVVYKIYIHYSQVKLKEI